MDELDGWLKRTLAPEPMLKLCQSMTALFVLWSTRRALPALLMLALPAATLPPRGQGHGRQAGRGAGKVQKPRRGQHPNQGLQSGKGVLKCGVNGTRKQDDPAQAVNLFHAWEDFL
jgi:hypothetical protein